MIASSRAAKFEALEKWSLVHRCCRSLLALDANDNDMKDGNHHRLDSAVIELGLKAAEAVRDPHLAADILFRAEYDDGDGDGDDNERLSIANGRESSVDGIDATESSSLIWRPTTTFHTDNDSTTTATTRHTTTNNNHRRLPPSLYLNAIRLCIGCRENDLAYRILARCSSSTGEEEGSGSSKFAEPIVSELYTVIMAGYAKVGDLERTERMFDEMKAKGLTYSEQAYSAYLHALAINGQHDKALTILESMMTNANGDGIQPKSSSFTACMLSAMEKGAWHEVLRLNNTMIQSGISPNATSLQGVVIACSHMMGEGEGTADADALHAMESAIESETPIDRNSFLTCARFLTKGVFEDDDDSNDDVVERARQNLRRMADNRTDVDDDDHHYRLSSSSVVKERIFALSRSLRLASVEDARRPSKMKNSVILQSERDRLWRGALVDTIRLARVLD